MLRWSVLREPRNALSAIAWALGFVAALLMGYFPPQVRQYTKDGQSLATIGLTIPPSVLRRPDKVIE
jgi:hypothetical protein